MMCMTCHADRKDIIEAIGLRLVDLLPESTRKRYRVLVTLRGKVLGIIERLTVKPEIVAVYPYADEHGEVLYEVVRYEPKDFRQRRPDDLAEDGYVWGLGDTRRVLYNLPDIVRFPTRMVICVEGEKDCERLRGLGALATTNVGGVGMGWQDSYSQTLAGRRCVVIPDQDTSGMKHAYGVVGSLLAHNVGSVRLVRLPRGKDVSDFLDSHGGTRNELIDVIKQAKEWK